MRVMKQIFAILLFNGIVLCGHAQLNMYSALTIPDSLRKDADVVVREEIIKFSIKDINSAKYDVHQVYTILNENGKQYLNFRAFSYEFMVLDDAEIKVYDALGVKKNTFSKKEMTSFNYGDGLVPEGKLTVFNVSPPAYPVTIEINYTTKYKGLFSYPSNYFQLPNQSVQKAVFDVEVPADLSFRYKMLNSNCQPVITKEGSKDLYHWELKNLPPVKLEKHVGSAENYFPYLLIAPNKFQLDDYDGDMTSWKNFGDWYKKVYLKTTQLSADRKLFYNNLVKDAKTDIAKAEILYNYLQNNMRYVSIQLGIGGLKPFPASFVDDKKYGDCKALSNYLKTVLDAVGVKSNVVIIEAGTNPGIILDDFPAHYFNHVILNIPQPQDTIWLECTSTTLPFAQLGPFTENRKGMMVTDNGGVLVNTPISNYKTNSETVNTFIEVNEDGGAKVKANYTLFGDGRDDMLMHYHDLKEDEKRRFFISNMEWKNPDNFEISNSKNKANPYQVTATMDYEKIYSFNAGSKLFFETRLYPIFDEEIPENEKRIRDYYFTCPYQAMDTTVYKFPAGFSLETIPKNKLVEFSFAYYACNYTWDAATHTLTAIALLQIKDRVIKATDYTKLIDFKKQVMADVNEKIVMKKE
jgi:transglutaminase-like putative cysteine protease